MGCRTVLPIALEGIHKLSHTDIFLIGADHGRNGPNNDVLVVISRGILTDACRSGLARRVLLCRATAPRRGPFLAATIHYTTEDTQVASLMPIRVKFSNRGEHY